MAKKKKEDFKTHIPISNTKYEKGIRVEIYAYPSEKARKRYRFRALDRQMFEGKYRFGNRIIAKNGKVIHAEMEFNSPVSAQDNIDSLVKACVVIMMDINTFA